MNMMEYGLLTEEEMNVINSRNEMPKVEYDDVKFAGEMTGTAGGLAAAATAAGASAANH